MKRFFLLGLTALIALTGCEKDFEVAAPYKDITWVYGIVDPLDTAHYIRIQKAFLDENKSAIEMSKIPDSSYYPNLVVKMQEYTTADKLIREFALNRVDMNQEGLQKDHPANSQGFFTSPNYGYKFTEKLTPFAKYRIIINNPDKGKIDTSQFFRTVSADTSKGNDKFYISAFTGAKYEIDFSRSSANYTWSLSGTKPLNGVKFQGKMRFNYIDKNALDGTETQRSVEMFIPARITNGNFQTTTFTLETLNKTFYAFLRDAIGLPPTNVERYLGEVEVYVYAGSTELANYEAINSAQSGGLTGDQIKPNYTNMASKDALGLIGSRTFRVYDHARLTDQTIDSLIINPITSPLKIKGRAQ